jgi:hypothetical protein
MMASPILLLQIIIIQSSLLLALPLLDFQQRYLQFLLIKLESLSYKKAPTLNQC